MPQHKSCEKRMRVSRKQNAANRRVKSAVKTATKKFLVAEGDEATEAYQAVSSELDRAARKGTIPQKRADRRKSRLAKALNRKQAGE